MKSILLIGLNNFGVYMAKQLRELGHQVMAVDKREDRIDAVLPFVTDAQIGDSTSEPFLRSLGINNYDVCLVAIGNDFQGSLETASLLKELGAKLVVARADREVQAKFLLRNGADEVINPEKQIFEITVPRDWVGKTVGEIDIRKRFGINIMAVKENGHMNLTVTPDTVLSGNRTMLVLGEHRAIQRCFRI